MKDPWRKLVDYESYNLVKRAFKQIHDRELSARRINDITSQFSQSKEYFRSANDAALSVKPLLQYYGVLSASRAAILLLSRDLTLAQLKPSHGLGIGDWSGVIAKGLDHLGELEIVVQNGTFLELLVATGNISPLRANSSAINWKLRYDLPVLGSVFSLFELVSTVPDLRDEFTRWTGVPPTRTVLNEVKILTEENVILFKVSPALEVDAVRKIFPPQLCNGVEMAPGTDFRVPKDFCPHCEQSFEGPFGIGDVELVAVIRNGLYINTIGKFVAMAYILSMLVRYFPSTWLTLGRSAPGDRAHPVVSRIIELTQSRFPQILLDYIDESLKKPKETGP